MRALVSIHPWAYIFGALLILTLPLNWLLAAAAAGVFHELCHYFAIRLCRGRVYQVRIGITGAEMETAPLSNSQELACALAGPAGSLALLCLCPLVPRLALCGLAQGLFNLLPVYPLDGGRALGCLLRMIWPLHGDKAGKMIGNGTLAAICLLSFAAVRMGNWGLAPLLSVLLLTRRSFFRKSPCKLTGIGVQ